MKHIITYLAVLFNLVIGSAQMILMDQGSRLGALWVFPSAVDSNTFYYLPNEVVLGKTSSGLPQFSFLRYVALKESGEDNNTPVTQADGGAILHFLLRYNTDSNLIAETEEKLRRKLGNNAAKIKAPIIFDEASFVLVSSILKEDGQKIDPKSKVSESNEHVRVKKVLALSTAPVLEGGKMAFSFKLNPTDSKILLESLKMDTPDVSLIFQLKFSGFSSAFKAEIVADWDQIYKHKQEKETKNAFFFKEETKSDIKELTTSNAVQVNILGDDKNSKGLWETAYNKILDLVYEPIDIKKIGETRTIDDLERAWEGAVDGIKDMKTMGLSSIGANNAYQYKEIRQSGKMHYSLNKANQVSRHHFLTFNIGDLHRIYGDNEQVFKTVNILDPDYMQRDVFISLDGSLKNAFTDMVNSINVNIKKKHKSGKESLKSIRIDAESFESPQAVSYGNEGDFNDQFLPEEMEKWMMYQYEVIWDFKGGEQLIIPYGKPTKGDVNLYIPYEARNITFMGNAQGAWASGAKAVVVDIKYDFFGNQKTERKVLAPGDSIDGMEIFYLAPAGKYGYEYKITKVIDNNNTPDSNFKKDDNGVIIIQ